MSSTTTYTCDHCREDFDPHSNYVPVFLNNEDGSSHMKWSLSSMQVNSQLCRKCMFQAMKNGVEAFEEMP